MLNCWWKSMLGIITGNRPPRLDCLEMSRLATALLCHTTALACWIAIHNVLYLHCMQVLATAPLCHSSFGGLLFKCIIFALHANPCYCSPLPQLCSAQQQQPLFQITPVHNINTYKAILATTALWLFSCVTALGGLLFTVPLAIPSVLLSSLYHYSYMLHSLDAYEIWSTAVPHLFLLLELFFITALAFQSDPALYSSCTVIRQRFCILKSPTMLFLFFCSTTPSAIILVMHWLSKIGSSKPICPKSCFLREAHF